MGDDQFYSGDEEREAAEDRIARIRAGSSAAPPARSTGASDELESEAVSRVQARGRLMRATLEDVSVERAPMGRARGRGRTGQAVVIIGGVVGIGIVLLIIIALVSALAGGGGISLPFIATKTPTPLPTATATPTPLPTETPTPTKVAPRLNLPNLTCIFQSGQGCADYCQDSANANECGAARRFVEAQGADFDFWLSCVAPGPGPNVGNPQTCLEDAWRKKNP